MNADRAKSLVYVHYNHRLLTRYREDYGGTYKNYDSFINDDNLEKDMEALEDREYVLLHSSDVGLSSSTSGSSAPHLG